MSLLSALSLLHIIGEVLTAFCNRGNAVKMVILIAHPTRPAQFFHGPAERLVLPVLVIGRAEGG